MKYDLLIKGGRVIDGTGAPWINADVAVKGRCIEATGHLKEKDAETVIDAEGLYITPGFIDIHTHSDIGILLDPTAECAIRQGVTTHVVGNCGDSPAPVSDLSRSLLEKRFSYYAQKGIPLEWHTFAEFLNRIESAAPAINIAALVGHSSVRLAVMGFNEKAPAKNDMRAMKAHIAEAMRAGAFGMSTGLVYPPGCFARTEEIIELACVVARYHGYYASHIRGERETIVEAVKECIAIGETAGCPVQISHNNPKYGGWGKGSEIQALWEQARERGVDVTVDNDIHTDFAPPLSHALPQWLQGRDESEMLALISDKESREAIRKEIIADEKPAFGPVGLLIHALFDRIWILRNPADISTEGRTVREIATERNCDDWNTFFDLIRSGGREVIGLFDYQDIEEIKRTVSHRLCMICSDGWVIPPDEREAPGAAYIPCSYGEFPGLFERFVCREKVFTVEEAVRKITSMPAGRLGLQSRGLLREGFHADITVFDLERLRDRATDLFPHRNPSEHYPHHYPEGIEYVLVNGTMALNRGKPTALRAGTLLRRGKIAKS
ncbi:MAG: amidohydrolase family protein [Candidatus Xenobiia bacterium LiM19]